ncbi:HPr kinase/phosphatase C-terminal domain-containing protein [Defluviimonas sp. WL0024]|uniref:HPr kinase/phosphatase C-terminal domain-containing protein n=2 Tax=Albidovulum TaxID=205889 RepID=A0ABT3IYT9_9RHOB|nr:MULTISPECIES: HPr kinase/phosphatase C-terminal domain-containing protein [Defluviimonas]MCU9848469.1 HPr kinase/phosphatase C-terminal domain-containing protein [Defluviimonas sp. WL0024]MCW3780546.1 HPr kinase/phosphatase C-terminal domain-containing protein [Defluviimonas salinarum]
MSGEGAEGVILHAGCVALNGRGALILGPSGSGKSALALQLMAFGCDLVSDDRTLVTVREGTLVATSPQPIRGRIEARGVGLLAAEPALDAELALVVDLAHLEPERLPPWHVHEVLGIELPLLHRVESPHFPAAILQYLKAGRAA